MNKREFLKQREPSWRRFRVLIEKKKRTVGETAEFSRLFRELSNDLAIIRSREWGRQLVAYLNHLVARGHNAFYRAPPNNLTQVGRYLAVAFPRLFRANIGYFFTAAILFFGSGAISWAVVQSDPSLASRIIPTSQLDMFEQMYASDEESDKDAEEDSDERDDKKKQSAPDQDMETQLRQGFGEESTFMAGFYIYNNVGIALKCFACGILLGVGTVYALLYNGIVIGAVAGYIVSQGHGEKFLSFVFSHGSFELTAIAVAGGAGLMLGNAVIHPGQFTRLESLRVRGLDAVKIACGAGVMLAIAALIEAFWSPSGIPPTLKYIGGSGLWIVVFAYLLIAGRGAKDPDSTAQIDTLTKSSESKPTESKPTEQTSDQPA